MYIPGVNKYDFTLLEFSLLDLAILRNAAAPSQIDLGHHTRKPPYLPVVYKRRCCSQNRLKQGMCPSPSTDSLLCLPTKHFTDATCDHIATRIRINPQCSPKSSRNMF